MNVALLQESPTKKGVMAQVATVTVLLVVSLMFVAHQSKLELTTISAFAVIELLAGIRYPLESVSVPSTVNVCELSFI